MNNLLDGKVWIAVFPYLKTTQPVVIRGLEFRSSEDIAHFANEIQGHLTTLFSLFILQGNRPIERMSYVYFEIGESNNAELIFEQLRQARILLNYAYAIPQARSDEPFLPSEHSWMYLFTPTDITRLLDSSSAYAHEVGYRGWFNMTYSFVRPKDMHIYPPLLDMWINLSQDIYGDLLFWLNEPQNWALSELFFGAGRIPIEIEKRVFTAIQWYNRSCAHGISDDVALVNMAIALESLLGLEESKELRERFRQVVLTLLGPVPYLDSWLEQFYSSRSEIVHEGSAAKTYFYLVEVQKVREIRKGSGQGIQHKALSSTARSIFRLCLNVIISGARTTQLADLASALIPNQKRLLEINEQLAKSTKTPDQRLRSVAEIVLALHRHHTQSDRIEVKSMLNAGNYIIRAYLDTKPDIDQPLVELMKQVITQSGVQPIRDTFDLYRKLDHAIEERRGRHVMRETDFYKHSDTEDVLQIVWLFVDYIALEFIAYEIVP